MELIAEEDFRQCTHHIVSKVVRLSKNKAMIFYKKFIDCCDEMGNDSN